MTIKVGINGYGRIGRNMLRALYEGDKRSEIEMFEHFGFSVDNVLKIARELLAT